VAAIAIDPGGRGALTPVQHELRFTFDEAFLRAALKRDLAWRGVYATLLLIGVLVVLWLWQGSVSWMTAAILGAGAVALWLLLFRVWRTSARRIFDLWSTQCPDRTMAFRFDDEGFDVEVGSASNRYVWQGMRRLWRYTDVWLLEIVKNMSVFFPPEAASDEVKAYVVERCRDAGVRV